MSIWQVLGFIGIGTVIGSAIQAYFSSRMQKKKLLFEARAKAYQGMLGKLYNLFAPESIAKNWPEYEIEINNSLSEAFLLGSKKLIILLADFKCDILELLSLHNSKTDDKAKEKFQTLKNSSIVNKIHEQMRNDLFVK